MTAPACHPDRPYKARGMCKPCWARDQKARKSGESAAPVQRASDRASVLAPTAEAPAGQMAPATTPPVAAPRAARKASRHTNAYAGPLCPTDPEHGPLVAWTGTVGYWCPHQDGHAADPAGAWFSQDQVEAAQRKALAS